ncbi:hypothetical protein ColTof3_13038 [Colletotrichum tofieldiae]|nr:hypothetical protein ColTof3_13038 [Colletotrichum tofieldiae]
MSTSFGTHLPSGGIGGGGGSGGETEPEEPKESLTTSKSISYSSSTSSCSITYTVAPHCTQPCVVSQIKSLGTGSYTTSCAVATCRTTHMCTSIETTTKTTFTTKGPKRTAACMPKRCPACQQNTPEAPSKKLEARQGFWDEVILKETITEPETWEEGEYDWWEKMRRVAKTYGPGLHIDSKYRMDSSSSWTPLSNAPHGGGAGPVWGCAIVVAFSPRGVYANHLWEIPNFSIPPEEEEYFNVHGGYSEDYYFKQNIEMFLQQGSVAFPFQEQYPALAPMVDAGGPLHPKDFQFFRTIVFVPTHDNGEMFYKRDNRRIINLLSDNINIDKKYITIYGYQPRFDLGKDFDYDFGRATPPPRIRASNPWDGLFSWLYTPKGPSGQRELVVRYEKNIIHREAWCGDGRAIPDAPPSNFDLRPSSDDPPAALQLRQEDATCGRFIVCGLGNPEALCGDYQAPDPPSNGPTKAERELSTNIIIDPEDAIGGEIWWWDRMRNAVDERGAGYGGHPENPGHWSTSTMVTFDQEIDGTATNRPRFGGSGPIWGCTAIVVASPEAIWTSHIWELPSHARGEAHGRAAFEQWSKIFPRPTVEYFREEFLDFLDNGNTKGKFKQLYEYKFPGRNPGLEYMFMKDGVFNVKEKEFVWVGIVTRSYKNLEMPRVQYDWQIQQVYEKFIAWGVEPENIKVKAYPARLDFTGGGSQIKPHWGILSWQYHPRHREGNHEEKKIRIRFEKEILLEKSWCGSGLKMAEPEDNAPSRRRHEGVEVCKMNISSKESALATRVSTAVPEPTQACTSDSECGSLSCPENRFSACYHDFCHCVILANPNNTEVLAGTVYATPTTTLEATQTPTFPISWLLPNVSSTIMSSNTSLMLSKSLMSAPMGTSTIIWLSSSPPSRSLTTVFTSNLTATTSAMPSTVSSMFTFTLSAWSPEESPGDTCTTTEDCSALKCSEEYPRPDCHCFDKHKQLLDVCSTAADCASVDCEARHTPTCRPLVDFPGATPICLCDAELISPGTTCLVDTHCDGLLCGVANQRGFCKSNACQCDFFLPEGAGCSAHDDCSPIRCSEAKPHKSCSTSSNACECSASAPAPRRAEGDPCSANAECGTIGCTDFEASVCEANLCRCRAWKCGSDKDCDSSGKTCDHDKNLRCEGDQCVCKSCTATSKILGCGSDGDCNHCCARGKLPTCVFGCQSFWCGKECQCETW